MTENESSSRQARGTRNTADIGRLGEDLAADHLRGLGWTILTRNWRNRHGELDVVAADGSVLVIVEVKTRASHVFADPAAAVTPRKLARMRSLARMWLSENREAWWSRIRFDVVSVQLDSTDPFATERAVVRHHRGVFE
ncbi:YraN family protein [Gordonia sp. CPCC 206044]|uniref:YraN family protein n=1 Tax=Gordonia sp. CPCC 206044 TaxID=3140793 RepID=UPI003AF40727